VVAERPDGSMMAAIERVQGQVDQMIPTLAAVAGVDETEFQAAPNSVDLKQFGDMVTDHESRIVTLEDEVVRWQEKGAVSHNANGVISALTFNNMTVGQTYRYSFYGSINGSGVANYNIDFTNGSSVFSIRLSDSNGQGGSYYYERVIVATGTTMTATMTITDAGGGITAFARLEELGRYQQTTAWT
jgi:hypothetical protein